MLGILQRCFASHLCQIIDNVTIKICLHVSDELFVQFMFLKQNT